MRALPHERAIQDLHDRDVLSQELEAMSPLQKLAQQRANAGDVDIAAVAMLLADPARATMLLALADGRALTAGELARQAQIAPSTASAHLAKLVASTFVAAVSSGRHRYFRLTSPTLASVIESLSLIAPSKPVRSLRQSQIATALRAARTCYGHLAGAVGVALAQRLVAAGYLIELDEGYLLTANGQTQLAAFGVPIKRSTSLPQLVPSHIDWSERRRHLAGPVAVALTDQLVARQWIGRLPGSRAVRVTAAGHLGLAEWFGLPPNR